MFKLIPRCRVKFLVEDLVHMNALTQDIFQILLRSWYSFMFSTTFHDLKQFVSAPFSDTAIRRKPKIESKFFEKHQHDPALRTPRTNSSCTTPNYRISISNNQEKLKAKWKSGMHSIQRWQFRANVQNSGGKTKVQQNQAKWQYYLLAHTNPASFAATQVEVIQHSRSVAWHRFKWSRKGLT